MVYLVNIQFGEFECKCKLVDWQTGRYCYRLLYIIFSVGIGDEIKIVKPPN